MTFQLGSTTFSSRSDVESDARLLVLDALQDCDTGDQLLSFLENCLSYSEVSIGTDTDGSNNYIFSGSVG
ncbi:MAG: hypothetical protein VYE26_04870 [Pseudomonadota bacterium]|jgi:hypothetical protein|nr:hypothetical protein [Pseudomonadota bacterium]